ncbi:putative creatinine amidohydrolase [Chitinispirillum alkaliphilum]|nr:putative creatinine amidohydrolase [Chitinispirillum alkaliphilum]
MDIITSFQDTNSIENLSFGVLEKRIKENPVLVVPLGGTEPYGSSSMGTANLITGAISTEVSERLSLLRAPVMPYGCSGPFMSFCGTSALKPATFKNVLFDLFRGWMFQGFTKFVVLNGVVHNTPVLEGVLKQLNKKRGIHSRVIELHKDQAIRDFYTKQFGPAGDLERFETAFMSIASFLWPDMVKNIDCNYGVKRVDEVSAKTYQTWKKRGMDPQKLRKMAPEGLINPRSGFNHSLKAGEHLFNFIVDYSTKEISRFLEKE